MFDESKGWNWSQSSDESCREGNFKITLGEFGNNGIQETNPDKRKIAKESDNI